MAVADRVDLVDQSPDVGLVEVVVAPFRFSYFDLHIPAKQRTRHQASCEFADEYVAAVGGARLPAPSARTFPALPAKSRAV